MYRKQFFVFQENRPIEAIIRSYTEKDFEKLIQIQRECFPPPFPEELWWNKEQLQNHIQRFSEGALCLEVDGQLAGSMTTLLVNFSPENPFHSWADITDNGYIRNHQPEGNTLYVVDISIRPAYRKTGLGKWLMQSMYELVVYKQLDRLLGGSRMPGYAHYANALSAEQYLQQILDGHIADPVISFLLRCGRTPLQLVPNYLDDEQSCNYGVLMEWRNPYKNFKKEASSNGVSSHHINS